MELIKCINLGSYKTILNKQKSKAKVNLKLTE